MAEGLEREQRMAAVLAEVIEHLKDSDEGKDFDSVQILTTYTETDEEGGGTHFHTDGFGNLYARVQLARLWSEAHTKAEIDDLTMRCEEGEEWQK